MADSGTGARRAEERCAGCGTAITSWFEINGQVACDDCKDQALSKRRASHWPTLVRGGALGFVAAVIGAAIYYAIAEVTGKEFGLVSIALGLMVGCAVRIGSRGRGGWRYQALAMFLCYAAISSTYVPRVISAAREKRTTTASASPAQSSAPASVPAASVPAAPPRPSAGRLLQALGMLFLLCLAMPFLGGADNLMGLVIIAIGLYEAWKVNAGPSFSVAGPFLAGETRGS